MRALALMLLLCSGCFLVPEATHAGPEPMNVEAEPPADADEALEFVVAEWSARLGVEAPTGERPRVRWFEPMIDPATGAHLIEYEGLRDVKYGPVRVHSMYWPLNGAIHVLVSERPSGDEWSDGIAHEPLHYVLLSAGLDGDQEHAGAIWNEVDDVQVLMREQGL